MHSILAIPDGKAHSDPIREGTVEYPLYLPGAHTQEFNDFLLCMYRKLVNVSFTSEDSAELPQWMGAIGWK